MADFSRASFLKMTAVTAAAGILAACSTGSQEESSSNSSSAATTDGPITLENAYGTTTLESVPQKIAVVNAWKNADVLLALGVVPAGLPKVTWGQNDNDSTDWFDAKLKDLGAEMPAVRYTETEAPDYEALAQLEPDVIFSVYGNMNQEIYDKLSKIAPVVTHTAEDGVYGSSWQTVAETAGKMLNREDDAKKLVEDTEKELTDKIAEYSNLQGSSIIAGYFDVEKGTFGAYTSADSRPQFFTSIGMKTAAAVLNAEKTADGAYYIDLSAETLDTVQTDVNWAWVNDPADIEKIQANELFAQMPAVKNNATVYVSDMQTGLALSAASPLSILWYINNTDQLQLISDAVASTKKAS